MLPAATGFPVDEIISEWQLGCGKLSMHNTAGGGLIASQNKTLPKRPPPGPSASSHNRVGAITFGRLPKDAQTLRTPRVRSVIIKLGLKGLADFVKSIFSPKGPHCF